MDLFIDTNVFLAFFHYSTDDLEELKKLAVLLKEKRLRLLLPEQVVVEFRRNRESKIADSLKQLQEVRLSLRFPQMCKDYPEYEELRGYQRSFGDAHKRLIERIIADAEAKSLKADALIQSLFDAAVRVETTPLLARARLRCDVGNPPGKKGSLGDAINWEALLQAVESGNDLHLVSGDGDYCSALDVSRLDGFLLHEWEVAKKSKIIFFKQLALFFREEFPDIRLASEMEKDLAIRDLATSGSFAQTHQVIARLAQYTDFTASQLNEIVSAVLSNNQVYWIASDTDVHTFLSTVLRGRENQIDPENLQKLGDLLAGEPDAPPF